jgi:hypothetical protein
LEDARTVLILAEMACGHFSERAEAPVSAREQKAWFLLASAYASLACGHFSERFSLWAETACGGSAGAPQPRLDSYRPAACAARIAQHPTAVTAAPEDTPVGQRHPVPAALHLEVYQSHVQVAGRIGAEGRAPLELVLN